MKVLNCIFGVFSIISAIYCAFYPGITFLNSGWIVATLLGVWGICRIITFATRLKSDNESKGEMLMPVLGLMGGISAAVVSLLALFLPGIRIFIDIIICIFSGWLVVSGITSFARAIKLKKSGAKMWLLTLICGILVLIASIYGFFHLIFVAQTIGMLIGILFMTYGIRLIISVFENTENNN